MQIVDILLEMISEAPGNPNVMGEAMAQRLDEGMERFGQVVNLVVRPLEDGGYEMISGHQRAKALRKRGDTVAPCVVIELSDADARLLGQTLNHIHGEDDLGLRAELLREVLDSVGEDVVTALLPETRESLAALASLGQEDMASSLQAWESAQAARLKHLQVQLTTPQSEVVEKAIEHMLPRARELKSDSPNLRGKAIYLICRSYLESKEESI